VKTLTAKDFETITSRIVKAYTGQATLKELNSRLSKAGWELVSNRNGTYVYEQLGDTIDIEILEDGGQRTWSVTINGQTVDSRREWTKDAAYAEIITILKKKNLI
jgi:hypothetical protein